MNKLALGKGRQQIAHCVRSIFFIGILLQVVASFLLIAVHVPLAVIITPCLFPAVFATHPRTTGFDPIAAILWVVVEWHGAVTVFFYDYYIVGPSAVFLWVIHSVVMAG